MMNLFNANFYRSVNPDLANFSDAQALAHFQGTGLNEGRAFSPLVDLKFYRASNSDLAQLNMSNSQLLEHLQNNGLNEKRKFSLFIDLGFYQATNSDLSRLNGQQLLEHLQTNGLNEQREFSPFIDLGFYQATNSDLSRLNGQQLLEHLQTNGLNEQREFSPFVDLGFYQKANSDLSKLNRKQLLEHLQTNGLNEQREFSPFVNLGFYQEANSDLSKLNSKQLLKHLQTNGLNEKRTFSPIIDLNLYQTFNIDLVEARLSSKQLLEHLEIYGISEGREFSYPFSLEYYGNNNPDLITAYAASKGTSTDAVFANSETTSEYNQFLFGHFIIAGINEGRRSSEEFDINAYMISNADLDKLNYSQLYKHFSIYGINEARVFSYSYNAAYYQNNNSAPAKQSFKQLFEYYITEGIEKQDVATEYPESKSINFIGEQVNLTRFSTEINGQLSKRSPNPTRIGSYAQDHILRGIEAGQIVTISMEGTNFDSYLQIIDATTEEIIVENDNESEGKLSSKVSFKVEAGVNYLVRASGINANNLGNYQISAKASSTITGNLVAQNGSINASLLNSDFIEPTDKDSYRKDYTLDLSNVADNASVKIELASTQFDAFLEVVNARTGRVLAVNDDVFGNKDSSSENAEITFVRKAGLEYIVRVSSYHKFETGNFTLTSKVVSQQSPSVKVDTPIYSTLLPSNSQPDIYQLDTTGLTSGSRIRVNLESPNFDTYLEVVPSPGTTLVNDNATASTTDSELELTIANEATYQIKVNRSPSNNSATGVLGAYELLVTPVKNQGSGITLQDSGLQTILGNKTSLTRSDMLAFFAQAQTNGITNTEQADLKTLVNNATQFKLSDSVRFLTDQVVSGITNNMSASDFESLVGANFFGTKPPTGKMNVPITVRGKTIELPIGFVYKPIKGTLTGSSPKDGRLPSGFRIRDINQVPNGTGSVHLAALGSLFSMPQKEKSENNGSEFLNNMIIANGTETYNGKTYESWTFRFYNNSNPYYVTVDRNIPTIQTSKGNLLPNARTSYGDGNFMLANADDGNAIWVPLFDRAYAQFIEQIQGSSTKSGYTLIRNTFNPVETLKNLTGRDSEYLPANKMNASDAFTKIKDDLSKGKFITVVAMQQSKFLIGSQAYTLTDAYTKENQNRIVIRNPLGFDTAYKDQVNSGDPYDGFIDIAFDDFFKDNNYAAIA